MSTETIRTFPIFGLGEDEKKSSITVVAASNGFCHISLNSQHYQVLPVAEIFPVRDGDLSGGIVAYRVRDTGEDSEKGEEACCVSTGGYMTAAAAEQLGMLLIEMAIKSRIRKETGT